MSFRPIARILALILLSAVIISAQEYPTSSVPSPSPDDNAIGSLGVQLITQFLTGDFVRHKIQVLFDIIDLKARLIHVISSFCTTENLIALKRFLDWVCRLGNFISQFLPNLPDDNNPKTALLGLLLNTFGGLSSTAPATPPPHSYGATKFENTDYVPENQTFSPDIENTAPVRTSPDLEIEESNVNERKLSDLSEDDVRRMLSNNEGVTILSKLISASRKR
ncbi:hypothetical protein WA026_005314 [Henosepilachna vigintioctopunctata]|uniref:Uncharacterized protein n=1 Tax=Henosepilachna vigintioctopunctata TaxID=420089 RepID=A0AAW1ULA2_9CUCU